MHLFYQPKISLGYLPEDESRHAVKVLRLSPGDEIEITDGIGSLYKAHVKQIDPRQCTFSITQVATSPPRKYSIHLAIAPTKNADRMEWMVEKCVEIGIEAISFVLCKTSERKSINLERLEKIAISAMKQSLQTSLPSLNEMIPFERFIRGRNEKQRFIAHVDENNKDHLVKVATAHSQYLVLIGPEGDFTAEELKLADKEGFIKVSLGSNRLRTETAGLAAVMALNTVNQG